MASLFAITSPAVSSRWYGISHLALGSTAVLLAFPISKLVRRCDAGIPPPDPSDSEGAHQVAATDANVSEASEGVVGSMVSSTDLSAVDAELSASCLGLHQRSGEWLSSWRAVHRAAQELEIRMRSQRAVAGMCGHLGLLARLAGDAMPFLADACPSLVSMYFQRAANASLAAQHFRRARALLQVGMPFRLMALSRSAFSKERTRAEKEAEVQISRRVSATLQALEPWGPKEREWRRPTPGKATLGAVEIHSLCDASGENLQNTTTILTERNHRAYAERWGYAYRMHRKSPLEGEEPQYGKLQIALQALESDSAPDWLLWLDCDALVTNRSISFEMLLETYEVSDADWVVAEEPNGINSGVFVLRGKSSSALRFLRGASISPWRFVWDQSMLLHRMAVESDLFAEGGCTSELGSGGALDDFAWAGHLRTVHQRAINLYTEGTARSWGASAWTPGDFVVHFAGCPLAESSCWRRFEDSVDWSEKHDR